MSDHTPEPCIGCGQMDHRNHRWRASINEPGRHDSGYSLNMVETDCVVCDDFRLFGDAKFAEACVNACFGMADPAAEIVALRAEVERLRVKDAAVRDLVWWARAVVDGAQVIDERFFFGVNVKREAWNNLKAAIAKFRETCR